MYYADPPAGQPPFQPPPPSGPGGGGGPVRPPAGGGHQGLAPVLVAFSPPAPQSRGTVAIRILLAIPHLLVLYALGVAAEIIAIIAWFAALFTGRIPDFAAEFLSGYLRWQTRVYAYLALLTDMYPPFALTDGPYPVRVAALPGKLNRAAVLFRLILVIPAGVVLTAVSYGAFTIVLFVAWLIALVTGRLPDALHWALAATLRYYVRVSGYMLLLTSAYPGGLFGDMPPVPAYDPVAFPPAPGFAPPADPWTLVLSGTARKLVGWFLAIGALLYAGTMAGVIIAAGNSANAVSRTTALNQLETAAAPVNQAETAAASATQACGQNLPCITKVDAHLASVYGTFASKVGSIPMPSGQVSDAATVTADATRVAGVYTQLGSAKTATQYLNVAESSAAKNEITALRTDFGNLLTALGGTPGS